MDVSCVTPWRGRQSIRDMASIQEHDGTTTNAINCYTDLPKQVFNLTYLEDNQTQNPESLEVLEDLRNKSWQIYIVGYLYNFTYGQSHINGLKRALNNALNKDANDSKYVSEVAVTEELSPTENDNDAIVITVSACQDPEVSDDPPKEVFKCYLMSWCNPVKASTTFLPLLLCNGRKNIRSIVLEVFRKQFDVGPLAFDLIHDDFQHLSLYSLIMLSEDDSGTATLYYKIPPGTIKLTVPLKDMLMLWSHIHEGDTNEVNLNEVKLFHNALELFCESTFGIKLSCAEYQKIKIDKHFSLSLNAQISSRSTKIIHVLLKYLNYLAVQRLKVKILERIHPTSQDVSR